MVEAAAAEIEGLGSEGHDAEREILVDGRRERGRARTQRGRHDRRLRRHGTVDASDRQNLPAVLW